MQLKLSKELGEKAQQLLESAWPIDSGLEAQLRSVFEAFGQASEFKVLFKREITKLLRQAINKQQIETVQ